MLQYLSFSENEMTKAAFVDFCIRSDNLNPAEITAILGIQPSRAWAKGEKYLGKTLDTETKKVAQCWRERPWGIWAIDSKTDVDSKRVEHHVLYLLDILEPKKKWLKHYVERNEEYLTSFYIWWESSVGHGSFEISSEMLKRMANLCQYIEFGYIYNEATGD